MMINSYKIKRIKTILLILGVIASIPFLIAPSSFYGNTYYPNSFATDQGATNAVYKTVFDILAATEIGATEKATIIFRHDGQGNTTEYKWDTSDTIPSNFTVIVEPGAIFTDTTGDEVLTIQGPFEAHLEQVFDWTKVTGIIFDSYRQQYVFPQWFGAKGDNSNDDTAEIQQAIDSITQSSWKGAILFIPPGQYKVSEAAAGYCLKVTAGITIEGAGIEKSEIYTASTNDAIIYIASDTAVTVRDLNLIFTGSSVAGSAGIYVTDLAAALDGSNSNSRIYNNYISEAYIGIHLYNTAGVVIDGNTISNSVENGIRIQNQHNGDEGDGVITNNFIGGDLTEQEASINWLSSGGFKISNNKLIGAKFGIKMVADGGGAAAPGLNSWTITNNSIEGNAGQDYGCGIYITDNGAKPNSGTIVGNQVPQGIYLDGTVAANLYSISIVGNTIDGSAHPVNNITAAINIADAQDIIVVGNTIRKGTNLTTGIHVEAGCVNISIGMNNYWGFSGDELLVAAGTSTSLLGRSGVLILQPNGGNISLAPTGVVTAAGTMEVDGGLTVWGGGVAVGVAPTGGLLGAGKINVDVGVYLDSNAYTNPDYVLQAYNDGAVNFDRWNEKKRAHFRAKKERGDVPGLIEKKADFEKERDIVKSEIASLDEKNKWTKQQEKERIDSKIAKTDKLIAYYKTDEEIEALIHEPANRFDTALFDINNFTNRLLEKEHLPSFPTKEEWDTEGNFGIGDMLQRLIETCEIQAIHIKQLNERLSALETK